jgi:hypothetical protein
MRTPADEGETKEPGATTGRRDAGLNGLARLEGTRERGRYGMQRGGRTMAATVRRSFC